MRKEMVTRTNRLQQATDNHILWCATEIAEKMTDQEITEYAAATGSRRIISTANRVITGVNARTGEKLTERDLRLQKIDLLSSIAIYIQSDIRDS